MSAQATLVEHLSAARVALITERDAAIAAIAAVDKLIAQYRGRPGASPPAAAMVSRSNMQVGGPTMAETITSYMRSYNGDVVPASEIVQAVTGSSDSTIRSQITKMQSKGEIVRVGRGLYALPENAEAPGATGASETEEPISDSSRQEGETHEQDAYLPRGGDHHPGQPGRDDLRHG